MKACILIQKLSFLCKLLCSGDTIATRTFCTLAAQDVYKISLVQQCIFLDSCLGTRATATILSNPDLAASALPEPKKSIYTRDASLTFKEAASRSSTSLIADMNWLHVAMRGRERRRAFLDRHCPEPLQATHHSIIWQSGVLEMLGYHPTSNILY